jgi:hypothetical protein
MPSKEIGAAIAMLEAHLLHYENLLGQSIENNEILTKTKIICKDLKAVSGKLQELKVLKGQD